MLYQLYQKTSKKAKKYIKNQFFKNFSLFFHPRFGYDYSSNGYYFITICTGNREHYFGDVIDDEMVLNEFGEIVQKYWLEIPDNFPFVLLDEFKIMPNHMHGVLGIDKKYGDYGSMDNKNSIIPIKPKSVNQPPLVNQSPVETRQCLVSTFNANNTVNVNNMFNINITKNIKINRFQNQGRHTISSIVGSYKSICTKTIHQINPYFSWQGNYYERIIRNESELNRIRQYIIDNPKNWKKDRNNKIGLWI